ncbi:MAG: tetratricopeptide repeat protein [Syntrophales bacterium]
MNESDNNRRTLLICIFLATAVIAIYWQVNNHDFINFDDNEYMTENRHVQTGLTSGNVTWAFTTFHAGNWHPLTWISHMLDCQLFGLKPGWHHLVNLLFHIANTLLLFFIFHRMTKALWQSAFVAAVFAIHPLHVESVAWVAERKDVLSTFFWMLTMGAYAFYVQRRELKRYLLAIFFFALGLMAKPMLVTLPFVLLLLDYWPLRRLTIGKSSVSEHTQSEKSLNTRSKSKKRGRSTKKPEHVNKTERENRQHPAIGHIILEKIPFFVLSLASSIVTYIAQQKRGAVGSLQNYPLLVRIENALVSYCSYIGKMVWPENLAVLYPHPGMLPPWQVVGAVLFLVITTSLVIRTAKRYPYLTTGWLWYLGTLVPVIGLVQVGVQAMADRYTYVPIIGLLITVAWGAPELLKKWRYRNAALATLAVIILCIFSFVSWKQAQYWRNSITLFTHALDVTTNNDTAHSNLGHSLLKQGKLEEAIHHYSEAVRICPKCYEENNNLGIALQEQGRVEEAISHYVEAIRLNPNYIKAYVNLGEALASQGKFTEAMAFFSQALQIKPDSAEVHYNIGTMLLSPGDFDKAIYHFRESIRIKPDYAKAYNNLGNALLLQGKIDEAIRSFQQALLLKPDYTLAQKNLNDALAHQKRNR